MRQHAWNLTTHYWREEWGHLQLLVGKIGLPFTQALVSFSFFFTCQKVSIFYFSLSLEYVFLPYVWYLIFTCIFLVIFKRFNLFYFDTHFPDLMILQAVKRFLYCLLSLLDILLYNPRTVPVLLSCAHSTSIFWPTKESVLFPGFLPDS